MLLSGLLLGCAASSSTAVDETEPRQGYPVPTAQEMRDSVPEATYRVTSGTATPGYPTPALEARTPHALGTPSGASDAPTTTPDTPLAGN